MKKANHERERHDIQKKREKRFNEEVKEMKINQSRLEQIIRLQGRPLRK